MVDNDQGSKGLSTAEPSLEQLLASAEAHIKQIEDKIRARRPTVLILMGSESDYDSYGMSEAHPILEDLGIPYELFIASAHRTPERMARVAHVAKECGVKVIIAGAGGSGHLPGMTGAFAGILPVLAVACTSKLGGGEKAAIDSTIFMPPGCPVAFMGVGETGAKNAALFAAMTLGIHDPAVRQKLDYYFAKQSAKVAVQPEKYLQKKSSTTG